MTSRPHILKILKQETSNQLCLALLDAGVFTLLTPSISCVSYIVILFWQLAGVCNLVFKLIAYGRHC